MAVTDGETGKDKASVIDRSRDLVLGLVRYGIHECSGASPGGIPTKVGLLRLDPPSNPGMHSSRTKRDPRRPSRNAKASLGYSNRRTSLGESR